MHASSSLLVLLPAMASALVARQANPTEPWVTVDPSGTPKTITPVVTTISGTPTIISGAPQALTASVFTNTNNGDVRVSTGPPPLPTATAVNGAGAGAFPVCENKVGPGSPFCTPAQGNVLNPGITYYSSSSPAEPPVREFKSH
jgi:hypothetical protein